MTPLKRLLFERGIKQNEFAKQCGVDAPNLSLIINGKRNPSIIVALKIANALEVSVEELWGYLLKENGGR